MKFLGYVLYISLSSQAYSQGMLVEPAPLSVEEDGTRKIISRDKGEAPAAENIVELISTPHAVEAVMTPNDDVINPPVQVSAPEQSQPVNAMDGQLRLDETPEAVVLSSPNTNIFLEYEQRSLRNYLQYSFGYLDSQYKKIDPSLGNGSSLTSLKFVADVSQNYQIGFAVEILNDNSGQVIPDSIRVLQYRLFFDYHNRLAVKGLKLDWVTGFGFSVGDFGIRKRDVNSLGQDTSVKIKTGMIVGLIPTVGLRFYLFDQNSLDLMIEYHQYFTTPQRYIGGMAFAPRFSFLF